MVKNALVIVPFIVFDTITGIRVVKKSDKVEGQFEEEGDAAGEMTSSRCIPDGKECIWQDIDMCRHYCCSKDSLGRGQSWNGECGKRTVGVAELSDRQVEEKEGVVKKSDEIPTEEIMNEVTRREGKGQQRPSNEQVDEETTPPSQEEVDEEATVLNQCGMLGGKVAAAGDPEIVNGNDARECSWRWQMGLRFDGANHPDCGGMLIHERWVLTAAHCFYEDDLRNGIHVVGGQHNIRKKSGNEQDMRVSGRNIKLHPKYKENTNDFDIALVKLPSAMKLNNCVGTVCLPTRDVAAGAKCSISGWGNVKEDGRNSNILQQGEVRVLSNQQCKKTGYKASEIMPSMLCAQGTARNGSIVDACQGDSGGPLVCESGGRWYVHGAVSFGKGCARRDYPGVYSRVTASLDWIRQTMR